MTYALVALAGFLLAIGLHIATGFMYRIPYRRPRSTPLSHRLDFYTVPAQGEAYAGGAHRAGVDISIAEAYAGAFTEGYADMEGGSIEGAHMGGLDARRIALIEGMRANSQ